MSKDAKKEEANNRFGIKIMPKDGELMLDDYLDTLNAVNELWRATCEHVTGDPDSVALKVTSMSFVCDGCGTQRPPDYRNMGWTGEKGRDFCPSCTQPKLSECLDES